MECRDGAEEFFFCMEHGVQAAEALQVLAGEAILARSYRTAPDWPDLPS